METIRFSSVVPQVFSSIANQLESDIWNTEAVFQKGHLYLVEADSGKGKSTFCSYVVGYRRDYSGHVMFDETDTMSFTVKDWVNVRQRHISHLFQELRLFPELTALENVEIKNAITGFKSREEQRLAMIRALVQPFDFILVDEPISHLDDTNSDIMAKIMMTEAKAQGAGVIVTSIGKRMNLNYEKTFKL